MDANAALKDGMRTTGGPLGRRLRGILVASQVALSVVLLMGAGLMINSLARMLNEDLGFDPDQLLGITQAYAGQISGLDSCLGAFWQAVEELPAGQQTLCALTSPRGFPLGQHGRIGTCDHPLFGELLQVPCMLRLPAATLAAKRVHSLVQPHNFHGTLLNWFEQTDLLAAERVTPNPLIPADLSQLNTSNWPASNDRAAAVGPEQRSLRTPAWFLHQPHTNPPQLYVKPDDRWETNDVANRCPDIVEQMVEQLDLCQQLFEQTASDAWPTLPELLAEGLD